MDGCNNRMAAAVGGGGEEGGGSWGEGDEEEVGEMGRSKTGRKSMGDEGLVEKRGAEGQH